MTAAVSVRSVGLCHLDLLHALFAASMEDAWSRDGLAGVLAGPGVTAGLGLVAGMPAGAALWRAVAGEGELLAIGVLPALRGRGVGRRLLCGGLAAIGVSPVFLEVAADNHIATRLYRSVGFEVIAERRRYYARPGGDVDALVMRWTECDFFQISDESEAVPKG